MPTTTKTGLRVHTVQHIIDGGRNDRTVALLADAIGEVYQLTTCDPAMRDLLDRAARAQAHVTLTLDVAP